MATNVYTTDYLLASLRRRGMLPSTAEALSDSDLLSLADEELHSYIVPYLMAVREEYLVASTDQAVTSGTDTYALPSAAVGGKLRDVLWSDGNGGYYSLPRAEPEWSEDYGTSTGAPSAYVLEANNIRLLPTPGSSGTLRLKYYRRPNRLVTLAETRRVASVTTFSSNYGLTLASAAPAAFTASETYDIVRGTPGFDWVASGVTMNISSSTSFDFLMADADSAPVSGDYVCLAGEAPIPQIPVELHPLLAQRTVVRALGALGHLDKQGAAQGAADELARRLETVLSPRAEGSARVIVNRFGPGRRGVTRVRPYR